MLSHRQLLIRATHWKLPDLRVEKEQETRQSLAACLLHIRPVGVCQPVSHGHRVRALQHNSGDRVYFNTTAVTECTSTQQRWQSAALQKTSDRRKEDGQPQTCGTGSHSQPNELSPPVVNCINSNLCCLAAGKTYPGWLFLVARQCLLHI